MNEHQQPDHRAHHPAEEHKVFSLANRWFVGSVGIVVLLALVAGLVGLVWLPRTQGQGAGGLWDAICSAAGVTRPFVAEGMPQEGMARPTNVIVYNQMLPAADNPSIGRGATLALRCTMCHGARGMSPADSPHLAGQPAPATYKQLVDFKSGHRKSAVMEPLVTDLSDQDMRDLAAYYQSLPREKAMVRETAAASLAPVLVSNGAPVRNIGACASCHALAVAKTATPYLDGLPVAYLRGQMQAFAQGARHNDINRQMRNVVHQMTPQEIDEVIAWYASR
ncbi:cytochrome c4 [Massilia arenosa]|uniref:Cytochrome c4 n=1 Tax=Zemynaea arenosa TaxID=2561931 RepID=A0A4Y9S0K0_9BURK|nr:c-type cytochrome [Massilia arenosa]TFW14854.1 cytochrome c4 [Massilia arenosa]